MDRAFRILTIYNRLLQNKSVNKQSLILELDTSPRTIQRDIDDIRNFLYESKSWISTPKELRTIINQKVISSNKISMKICILCMIF
ncbi:HTH domain-containing protein [Staphylococcus cohnii]|uniref:HTH domain-containing protein n=1 Tax=Staphylococcus cohnii TaxID=29382 RepID=UPI0021B396DB|nr:HTH domain-containing protein [Staphylococcus cohnii]